MTFEKAYVGYVNACKEMETYQKEANKFLFSLGLEYSLTYCSGDGVVMLDHITSTCGFISNAQLVRLSNSKNKSQAMKVIKEIYFFC